MRALHAAVRGLGRVGGRARTARAPGALLRGPRAAERRLGHRDRVPLGLPRRSPLLARVQARVRGDAQRSPAVATRRLMGGRMDGRPGSSPAAASGIGRACALRFAAEGAAVVVADLGVSRDGGEATSCRRSHDAGGRPLLPLRRGARPRQPGAGRARRRALRPARLRPQQRGHRRAQALRRDRGRGLRSGDRGQPARNVPGDEAPDHADAAQGRRGDREHVVERRADGGGRLLERLHREQARHPRADQERGRGVRERWHPGQRGLPGRDHDPADVRPAPRARSRDPRAAGDDRGPATRRRSPPPWCGSARTTPRSSPGWDCPWTPARWPGCRRTGTDDRRGRAQRLARYRGPARVHGARGAAAGPAAAEGPPLR